MHQAKKARNPAILNLESVAVGFASAFCCSEDRWNWILVQERGMVIKKYYMAHQYQYELGPKSPRHTSQSNR